MSKRQAIRALKRQKMDAERSYTTHLLDLWFGGMEIPGNGTALDRQSRKRQTHRVRAARP